MPRHKAVRKPTHVAFISMGSNLGDRQLFIAYGLKRLCRMEQSEVGEISGLYATQPVGINSRIPFLNMVVQLYTNLDVYSLLTHLQSIEKAAGRTRKQRKKARVLDMDILFYDNDIVVKGNLTVPHPEVPNRRFILQPLAEIAADFVHPVMQKTIRELLAECTDNHWVQRLH